MKHDKGNVRAFEHCLHQVLKAFQDKGFGHARPFLHRFLHEDIWDMILRMPSNKADQRKWVDGMLEFYVSLSYLCYHTFYKTYCKYESAPKHPANCRYDVLIPLRQRNTKLIQYLVVPKGAKAGDTFVCVLSAFPGPINLPRLGAILKPLGDRLLQEGVKPNLENIVPRKLPVQTVEALLSNFDLKRFGKDQLAAELGDVRLFYTIVTLEEEPFIRMPCYNVPLQCAYEMAHADLGRYLQSPAHLFKLRKSKFQLKQVTVNKITIKRNPPDMDMFKTMLLWPAMEGLHLSAEEKQSLFVRVNKIDGVSCKYSETSKSELFAKAVNRIFKKHVGLK